MTTTIAEMAPGVVADMLDLFKTVKAILWTGVNEKHAMEEEYLCDAVWEAAGGWACPRRDAGCSIVRDRMVKRPKGGDYFSIKQMLLAQGKKLSQPELQRYRHGFVDAIIAELEQQVCKAS